MKILSLRFENINSLKGAWKTNLEVRPEKDWEDLKGRSVVNV